MPVLSKGSNPKWSRKSHLDRLGPRRMGLSAPFGKAPGSARGAPPQGACRRYPPGFRARPRRQRGSCPGHANEKGPSFRGPLGRSGGEARIRTGGKGFAGLCLTTWPLRRRYEKGRFENRPDACDGADNGARTRDPNLGKVVLYQLSHVRLRVINIRDAASGRKEFFKDC